MVFQYLFEYKPTAICEENWHICILKSKTSVCCFHLFCHLFDICLSSFYPLFVIYLFFGLFICLPSVYHLFVICLISFCPLFAICSLYVCHLCVLCLRIFALCDVHWLSFYQCLFISVSSVCHPFAICLESVCHLFAIGLQTVCNMFSIYFHLGAFFKSYIVI